MRRSLLIAILFAFPALAADYEVFAIRYAAIPAFPVASLVQGAGGLDMVARLRGRSVTRRCFTTE